LLIAEPVSGLTGAPQVSDAYFNLYLFAMGRGRPRTYRRIQQLLHEAGFDRVKVKRTRRPLLTNVVIAQPKGGQM
jgi:demethylspheroidene O-methyltransferase